jgi:hypothetical protein
MKIEIRDLNSSLHTIEGGGHGVTARLTYRIIHNGGYGQDRVIVKRGTSAHETTAACLLELQVALSDATASLETWRQMSRGEAGPAVQVPRPQPEPPVVGDSIFSGTYIQEIVERMQNDGWGNVGVWTEFASRLGIALDWEEGP